MNTKFNMEVHQLLLDLSFLVDPETHQELVRIVGPEVKKQESLQKILDSIRTTADDVSLQLKMIDFDRWATALENSKLKITLEQDTLEINNLRKALMRYEDISKFDPLDPPEVLEEPPDVDPS